MGATPSPQPPPAGEWNRWAWIGGIGGSGLYLVISAGVVAFHRQGVLASVLLALGAVYFGLGGLFWHGRRRVEEWLAWQAMLLAAFPSAVAAFAILDLAGWPQWGLLRTWPALGLFPVLWLEFAWIARHRRRDVEPPG